MRGVTAAACAAGAIAVAAGLPAVGGADRPRGAPSGFGDVVTNDARAIEAAAASESYRAGDRAVVTLFDPARNVRVGVYRIGPERIRWRRKDMLFGVPVCELGTRRRLRAGQRVSFRVGNWPSGLYFVRLAAPGGRIGFAPFVVAPKELGEHPVAIVMPTNTWQAYNFRDAGGDGVGDSWYVDRSRRTVGLARPMLDRGVPFRFRSYDLPFLRWLDRTQRRVDVLADIDLESTTAERLARAYRLVIFPGHHEYVTSHAYDVIAGYRDRGGNLAFLSANNLYWRVDRGRRTLVKVGKWRDLGRPEASVVGVQFVKNDDGTRRGSWRIRSTRHRRWLFGGMPPGAQFSNGGIELDMIASASPRGTTVVAAIPDLFAPGLSGHMSYYETAAGAKVFAAGAFTIGGSALQPPVSALLERLWRRLSRP